MTVMSPRWWFADRAHTGPGPAPWIVGQWPNAAIAVFLAAFLLRLLPGAPELALLWVGRGALMVWGLDELLRGRNPFRRALGLAILAWQVVGVATAG